MGALAGLDAPLATVDSEIAALVEAARSRQRATLEMIASENFAPRAVPEACAAGLKVLTGGTDAHLVLVDLRGSELAGVAAEERLRRAGVTASRNAVPVDPRSPRVASGLRIGTAALATRGDQREESRAVTEVVVEALLPGRGPARSRRATRGIPAGRTSRRSRKEPQ